MKKAIIRGFIPGAFTLIATLIMLFAVGVKFPIMTSIFNSTITPTSVSTPTATPSPASTSTAIGSALDPEIEKQLMSNLSSTLDALEKTISWAFLALVATILSAMQTKDKIIKLGTFDISREYAGGAMFATLCILCFQAIRLFQNLAYSLDLTGNMEQATFVLRTHTWIFNPFSETSGYFSFLTNNLGLALLLLLWWLGFHTGFYLLRGTNKTWKGIGTTLSIIYLIFGLVNLYLIIILINRINVQTSFIKVNLLLGAIPIGAIGVGFLFNKVQSRITSQF